MGSGDDPVVGAGDAVGAGGLGVEGVLEGEEGGGVEGGGSGEAGLGFVEWDLGDIGLWCGEVERVLGGGMVAPGAYGVEIGEEFGGEVGSDGLAAELLGEGGGEVLEHDE